MSLYHAFATWLFKLLTFIFKISHLFSCTAADSHDVAQNSQFERVGEAMIYCVNKWSNGTVFYLLKFFLLLLSINEYTGSLYYHLFPTKFIK